MTQHLKPHTDAAIQAAFQLTSLSIAHVERLSELSLEQVKANAEHAQAQLSSVLETKDPSAAIELLKANLENSASSLASFALAAYDLSQQFHQEASQLAEGHFDEAHAQAQKAIQEQLKHAPAGSEALVSVVKSAIDASNRAIHQARGHAQKSIELASESVNKIREHAPVSKAKTVTRRKAK